MGTPVPSALTYIIGRIATARLGGPFLPSLGAAAHALDHPLNLAGRHRDAAGLLQMPLGFEVSRLVGPFQTNEFGQSRGVAHLQTQRGIGRIMALVLAGVIIVVPAQLEAAKNPLHPDGFPALATLLQAWVGNAASMRSAACWSNQPTRSLADLKTAVRTKISNLSHSVALRVLGFKPGDELLDFLFLGQEDCWEGLAFF